MTETRKKERFTNYCRSLGLLFSVYGLLTNWADSQARWTVFMGGVCGLTLLFSGLGITDLNGKLKQPKDCQATRQIERIK